MMQLLYFNPTFPDTCTDCSRTFYTVINLFNCLMNLIDLTPVDLWLRPKEVAEFREGWRVGYYNENVECWMKLEWRKNFMPSLFCWSNKHWIIILYRWVEGDCTIKLVFADCRHYLMIIASASSCSHHVEWFDILLLYFCKLKIYQFILYTFY